MKVKSERKVVQLCPILSNAMDCSLPGSSVHGIFQFVVIHTVKGFGVVNKAEVEVPLEKAMAPHSSALAWKIQRAEEPGGLHSMRLQSQTPLSD